MCRLIHWHPFYLVPNHPYFGFVHGARFNGFFLLAILVIIALGTIAVIAISKPK